MGIIVIAAYKPKDGKGEELNTLIDTHVGILKSEGLATDRESILMKSADGTIIEVFEWKSKQAIEAAHSNTKVQKMWDKFYQACDFIPLSKLDEAQKMFAEFTTIP